MYAFPCSSLFAKFSPAHSAVLHLPVPNHTLLTLRHVPTCYCLCKHSSCRSSYATTHHCRYQRALSPARHHVAYAFWAEQHGGQIFVTHKMCIICILVVVYSVVATARPLGGCRSVCRSNLRSCLIGEEVTYMFYNTNIVVRECARAGIKQGPQ